MPHFIGSLDISAKPERNMGFMQLPICCLLVCTGASDKNDASIIRIEAWKHMYHVFPQSL
jgi:hypothetical protein